MGKIYPATKDEGDGFCDAGYHAHAKEEIEVLPIPLPGHTVEHRYCPAHQLLACQQIGTEIYEAYAFLADDGEIDANRGLVAIAREYDYDNEEGKLISALVRAKAKGQDPIPPREVD